MNSTEKPVLFSFIDGFVKLFKVQKEEEKRRKKTPNYENID